MGDKIPCAELPVPRLELRWRDTGDGLVCEYSLIAQHLLGHPIRIPMGATKSSGSGIDRCAEGSDYRTPFRDGVHARWDMRHLGLPGFVIVDGNDAADTLTPTEDTGNTAVTGRCDGLFGVAANAWDLAEDHAVIVNRMMGAAANDEMPSRTSGESILVQAMARLLAEIERIAAASGIHESLRAAYNAARKLVEDCA